MSRPRDAPRIAHPRRAPSTRRPSRRAPRGPRAVGGSLLVRLHVNLDHVATIRQARRASEPDPVHAAVLAELGGADGITVHLREDRRHVQDRDVRLLRETVRSLLNLELAANDEILRAACEIRPDVATLVPERREEVTTEGGLDVAANVDRVARAVSALRGAGIRVSLFVDPEVRQVEASRKAGAEMVELHTGRYANARGESAVEGERMELERSARLSRSLGLRVAAGHGLHYRNVGPIARIAGIEELNIGHSIVSRAVLVGMERAVREMKSLVAAASAESRPP